MTFRNTFRKKKIWGTWSQTGERGSIESQFLGRKNLLGQCPPYRSFSKDVPALTMLSLDCPDHGERLHWLHRHQQDQRHDHRGEEESGDLLSQRLGQVETGATEMINNTDIHLMSFSDS